MDSDIRLYREWYIHRTLSSHGRAICADRKCSDIRPHSISRKVRRHRSEIRSRSRKRRHHSIQLAYESHPDQSPDQCLPRIPDRFAVAFRTPPHSSRWYVSSPWGTLRRSTELAHRNRKNERSYRYHESAWGSHIRKDTPQRCDCIELGSACLSDDDTGGYDSTWRDYDHECRVYRTMIWGYHREDRKTRRNNRESLVYFRIVINQSTIQLTHHLMWYWDYTPSSWGRAKPLTKAQIRRLQESYKNADKITAEVQAKESEEQEETLWETNRLLSML